MKTGDQAGSPWPAMAGSPDRSNPSSLTGADYPGILPTGYPAERPKTQWFGGADMSAQDCPNCRRRGFTWWVDEEASRLTQWSCGLCGYAAEEDESLASTCPECRSDGVHVRLSDPQGQYWFCLRCLSRTPATPDAEPGAAPDRAGE